MFRDKGNRKFILFYFIILYVFTFMFWWSYLLYSKTSQHYSDVANLQSMQYQQNANHNVADYYKSDEFKELDKKFKRQKTMIIAEGSVFLIVLMLGMLKIYNSFQQEMKLANQQKNFLLSITHELKSPLASIKLINETIKNRNLTPQKQNELLSASLQEINRLNTLVENILLAAKIENKLLGLNKNPLNLSNIVQENIATFILRNNIQITQNIEDNIVINGDMTGLNSIIGNLIENAIKYSPNPIIDIALSKTDKKVKLSVADNGKGIPESEKNKIFDKFYRVGNEETRTTRGTGLGLYLVRQLAKFHNGKITVANNKPQGSIFTIEFNI